MGNIAGKIGATIIGNLLLYALLALYFTSLSIGNAFAEENEIKESCGGEDCYSVFIRNKLKEIKKYKNAKYKNSVRVIAISKQVQAVLRNDGKVVCYKDYQLRTGPVVINGLSNIIDVVYLSSRAFYALRKDGIVLFWDAYCRSTIQDTVCVYSKATVVPGLKDIVSISGNHDILLALDKRGKVWATGDDWWGAIGNLPRLSAGEHRYIKRPVEIPLPFPMAMISVGGHYSSGIDIKGNVWTWGCAPDSRCARGKGEEYKGKNGFTATRITNIPKAKFIATDFYTYIVTRSGDVWTWWYTRENYNDPNVAPRKVEGLSGIVSVKANIISAFFKDRSGKIKYMYCGPDEYDADVCNHDVKDADIYANYIDPYDMCGPIIYISKNGMALIVDDKVSTLNIAK